MKTARKAAKRLPKHRIERWQEILPRIAAGESLRKVCAELGLHPGHMVAFLNDDKDLAAQYARAAESRNELRAHELEDIADGDKDDSKLRVARDRLRVDTKKWLMSKLQPRRWGDKIELTGANGGPVEHRVEVFYRIADGPRHGD